MHQDADDGPGDDRRASTEAVVACPYCGASNEIGLDPGGGQRQAYVEDCQVCCRPWQVTIAYGRDGTASVAVESMEG